MSDDGDPVLVALRRVALGFPGACEVESHGRPTFRAGGAGGSRPGKVFAVCGGGERGGRVRGHAVLFLPEDGEAGALRDDPRVFVPAYYGPSGWLGLDLSGGVDRQEVAELLDGSYRRVAAPALVDRLDAEGGPAGRPTLST